MKDYLRQYGGHLRWLTIFILFFAQFTLVLSVWAEVRSASSKANDTYRAVQSYLDQIGIEKAWDIANANAEITIAVIDTGVDLKHPDLEENMITGVNLLDPSAPPQDDNLYGHGTNVAGIIAAMGNNQLGISGILWKAKIMPIKAMGAEGSGSEAKLGEGIRYAVDYGAKIIVLSLGLWGYTPYMQEIVQYAEEKGVLLVAATGNEGDDIKYPAAYPTVLAVGGIRSADDLEPRSNFGPGLDLVAPWDVYTTALGGGYNYNEGTSMAAPQAAAAAALIWAKYPEMKPHEIRNLLRQTAQDIGEKGWDPRTGYGLLRIDRALTEAYRPDMYESNDQRETAKPLPIDTMITAELSGGNDQDWFQVEIPYDGILELQTKVESKPAPKINLTQLTDNGEESISELLDQGVKLHLKKGRHLIRLALDNKIYPGNIGYTLKGRFSIYRDRFEDNEIEEHAFVLPSENLSITGTFHQKDDHDWYVLNVAKEGMLWAQVSVDTPRMDPFIYIYKEGEKESFNENGEIIWREYDFGVPGVSEYTGLHEVHPGRYYILVKNINGDYPSSYPVTGEYTLKISYSMKDVYEPNDKFYEAARMSHNTSYNGVFNQRLDTDWFSFKLEQESYVNISLNDIPEDRAVIMELLSQDLKPIALNMNQEKTDYMLFSQKLDPGTYYIRLSSGEGYADHIYSLQVTAEKLISGFKDISGHWAQLAITELTRRNIITGYGDYTFRPHKYITRAEAASMIFRAFQLKSQGKNIFGDVTNQHWAYESILRASEAGVVVGYPEGRFKPDQPLTRAEMAMMMAKAMNFKGVPSQEKPFYDVNKGHWAAPVLHQFKQAGLLVGYEDGSFKPNDFANRAEFSWFLYNAIR
jgi:hypothetical protein